MSKSGDLGQLPMAVVLADEGECEAVEEVTTVAQEAKEEEIIPKMVVVAASYLAEEGVAWLREAVDSLKPLRSRSLVHPDLLGVASNIGSCISQHTQIFNPGHPKSWPRTRSLWPSV